MKRFIVIVLVLILVAGGGAGALIMLGFVRNPFAAPMKALTAAEQAASALDAKKFKPPESPYVLVKVEDMIIPVIINGQLRRRVFITARLMARGPADQGAVKGGLGAYQNLVIGDLVPFFQNYFADHDMIDLAVVKDRLAADAKQVYGDQVSDVLLTNVFEQSSGRVD